MYSESSKLTGYLDKLPCFRVDNLKILGIKDYYLRIVLHRLEKKGLIVRFKRGFYASSAYGEKMKRAGEFALYLEYLAMKAYEPSYLSLEYVLHENNLLTEMPQNFTLVTGNKTAFFANKLGVFVYHKIKEELFGGYKAAGNKNFPVYKARPAKALFDFLYFRKNLLIGAKPVQELRINTARFPPVDRGEFARYIRLEGSPRMKEIARHLFRHA
ncbi:MAG: type IV toxin-antitoxin system AbiEi family antitoxin domain-containing protein [Elusimicrobia bacterium]|nr:type IV toxin-antitoxin system AbiEi family antitoxin domain-containing protein [Elusimicrobiota bacterium]